MRRGSQRREFKIETPKKYGKKELRRAVRRQGHDIVRRELRTNK